MSNRCFHILIIAKADHRIMSADYGATDFLGHDRFSTLDEHMAEEDRPLFRKKMAENSAGWFYVRLRQNAVLQMFGMQIFDSSDPDYVRIRAVQLTGLVEESMENARRLESYETVSGLFDDIYYDYDPATDRIVLFHGEKSAYGTGVWPLTELSERMRQAVTEAQQVRIQEFVSDLRSGAGYFRIEVDTDVTGGPTKGAGTLLIGRRVSHSDGTTTVAGTLHQIQIRHDAASMTSSLQLDSLTGLVGRRDIIRIAKERISGKPAERTSLVITDIDFFKNVNDTFGHNKGDEVIRNVAGIISSVIGDHGVVGRYGGDEFLMVLYRDVDEESLRDYFRTIREEIHNAYPDFWGENAPLTLSVGCASFPADAGNYEDLFLLADYCLYRAKYKGRNRYIIYTPSKHGSLEAIRARSQEGGGFRDERNTSYADVLISMEYRIRYGEKPKVTELFHDFATVFDADNIVLMGGEPLEMIISAGRRKPASAAVMHGLEEVGRTIAVQLMKDSAFLVINDLVSVPQDMTETVHFLQEHGMYSLLGVRFRDSRGTPALLLMTTVGRKLQWNETHFKYYRIFTDILSNYELVLENDPD